MRGQDFVHSLMVKLNRVSIAAILTLVAIYGLVAYRGGTTSTAAQGFGTSGTAHVTTGITMCSIGSNDNYWLTHVHGPR